jgi:hypothetical protein
MSLRQTKLSPVLRSLAATTLFVWVGALLLCQSECCSGTDDETTNEPAHHHPGLTAHSRGHHDHTPAQQHHDENAFCLSVKSLLYSDTGVSHFKPVFQSLYALPSEPGSLQTETRAVTPAFRQAKPADFVFTPEVCLGPAFRSLAPPVGS